MTLEETATNAFVGWYEGLPLYSGFPAKGTIAGGLVVLEHLKDDFDLTIRAHTTKGRSQVRGTGRSARRNFDASWRRTTKESTRLRLISR